MTYINELCLEHLSNMILCLFQLEQVPLPCVGLLERERLNKPTTRIQELVERCFSSGVIHVCEEPAVW